MEILEDHGSDMGLIIVFKTVFIETLIGSDLFIVFITHTHTHSNTIIINNSFSANHVYELEVLDNFV